MKRRVSAHIFELAFPLMVPMLVGFNPPLGVNDTDALRQGIASKDHHIQET